MIALTGQVLGAESVEGKFTVVTKAIVDRVRTEVKRQGLELLRLVKQKLDDGVLHIRTGRLMRSINEKSTDDGRTFTSTTGTNVVYARIHELGASNLEENVRAYLRRCKSRNTYAIRRGKGMTLLDGSKATMLKRVVASEGFARVGAFTRHMNMPRASFLVSSLQDRKNEIRAGLTRAIQGGLQ